MRTLITCMGECLIDFLPLREEETTTDFRMYPAGSIFNVAMGVARLGKPVAFCGKISHDYFGRYLQSSIIAEGIDTRFLTTARAPSTLAFVAMDRGQPGFSFYGENAADTLLTPGDVPEALLAETGILHIGSISLLRGITPATVEATVERLKGKALLSLDPNIRSAIVQDEPAYRALLRRLIALVDVLKLSESDLAWLAPDTAIEQALEDLLAQGPSLVVITCGTAGAMAGMKASVHVPGMPIDVIDTVGAGDAFCAALLSQLMQTGHDTPAGMLKRAESELEQIIHFAVAASALNCTRAGANPPRLTEVEQFLASHMP
jgi:fructokinase